MHKRSRLVGILTAMILSMLLAFPMAVFAQSLDELVGSNESQPASQYEDDGAYGSGNEDAISAYLRGREPVTNDNMKKAAVIASPLVNVLGTIAGGIIMVTVAAVFAITAVDLAYIGVPPLRPTLNPAYGAQAGGMGGMGMGGMGMGGYGMRGGMMGGMGAQQQGATGGRCWVSDEAKWCVSLAAGNGVQAGGMGGMGMGGMGMGGMGMGGMTGNQQTPPMKSVILAYFKKRVFFIILFAVCTVVLMSSVLTDCGLNLGALFLKIVAKFSSQTTTVQF